MGGPKADPKERSKALRENPDFEMDENAARKIWAWGPETDGPNLVVDVTQGVQYINEIKEHVNSAFQWTTKEGPLCEESMRGIRYDIKDVTLHTDSIHRGAGQIMPPTRRCCFASEMTAKPTLQEPVFLVEITCPQEAMSGVYSCMNLRRGCVFEHWENLPGDAMQVGGKMEELILQIRKRKNLKVAMPALGDYLDKL